MNKKHTITPQKEGLQPYLMHIADLLSDDPILVQVIGTRFKVVAYADCKAKRVTYSFRCVDDTLPDEWDTQPVQRD